MKAIKSFLFCVSLAAGVLGQSKAAGVADSLQVKKTDTTVKVAQPAPVDTSVQIKPAAPLDTTAARPDTTARMDTTTRADTSIQVPPPARVVIADPLKPTQQMDTSTAEDGIIPSSNPLIAFVLPADGDVFYAEDVKIVAYIQSPTPAGMLAVLDGYSIDVPLTIEEGLFTLDLPGLKPGVHEIKVVFLNEKQEIMVSRTTRFFVRVPEPKHKSKKGKLRQFGRISARANYKGLDAQGRIVKQSKLNIDTAAHTLTTDAGKKPISRNGDGTVEGSYTIKYGKLEGYAKGLFSTDENAFQQASHRVSGRLSLGPWAYLKGGDVYPTYNPLVLNGTRIRGGEVGTAVVTSEGETHWVYAKGVYGETKRNIPFYVAEYDTGRGVPRSDTIRGASAQRLTAFRLGAGGGHAFDLAVTVLKAEERNGDANYQALSDSLHGIAPVDNVVTGVDLRTGFWDGRIQIVGRAATSIYTRNRANGTSDKVPKEVRDLLPFQTINSSTQGYTHLLSDDSTSADYAGYLNSASTWEAGITTSIPFSGITEETEIRYTHLGADYHSEGNPFLGSNPGDGISFQQRLVVLDNRLSVGFQASRFLQDLIFYEQEERVFKGELRYLPGAYLPAVWINGGLTSRAPKGTTAFQFSQEFSEFNVGGFHNLVAGPGRLYGSLLYGLSRSLFSLKDSSTGPVTETVTLTHIVNSALQYKFRGTDFTPRTSYTFASNDVQKPTHNVSMGAMNLFFSQRLRVDFDVLLGQYPVSLVKNDLTFGETFSLSFRIDENQTVRLREKYITYGTRASLTSGLFYEMFF